MPQWCFSACVAPSDEDANAFDVGAEPSADGLDEDVADVRGVVAVKPVVGAELAVKPVVVVDLAVEPVVGAELVVKPVVVVDLAVELVDDFDCDPVVVVDPEAL